MNTARLRNSMAVGVLIAAVILVAAGAGRRHRVYEAVPDEFGLRIFHRVNEAGLIEDSTFGGVVRRDGRLLTTYDRAAPRGKRSCPT